MTVYVDDMRAQFGRMIMCHMIGTDEAELHKMAAAIGVNRKWYQGDHYDISLGMRGKAISLGAVEITWRQAGFMISMVRRKQTMPSPDNAEYIYKLWREQQNAQKQT